MVVLFTDRVAAFFTERDDRHLYRRAAATVLVKDGNLNPFFTEGKESEWVIFFSKEKKSYAMAVGRRQNVVCGRY